MEPRSKKEATRGSNAKAALKDVYIANDRGGAVVAPPQNTCLTAYIKKQPVRSITSRLNVTL